MLQNRLYGIHLLFMLLVFTSINLIAQSWIAGPWTYRRPVTIANPGATDLNEYQIKITLDNNFDFSSASSDGSDLRVTTNDGITALPFWIEEWNAVQTRAVIWVKIPIVPAGGTSVYLYYGNSAATSESNGISTFNFFDDFSEGSYVGSWGPGYVAHDWKYASEMLHGALEYAYYNRAWNFNLESLDTELEQEFNYIHSQINQTTGQVISDPDGSLAAEPEYCYGLILSNLANGHRFYTHIGNSTLATRCYDDMVLVFDYLSATYPTVSTLNDAGGSGWLLVGFSNAWKPFNDDNHDVARASLALTIVRNYSSTFISNQAINGSWNGAVGVQEQLKRDLGLLWAESVTPNNPDYLTAVKNNVEYILSTYWNSFNGGLESFEDPSASDRFFEYDQQLFLVVVRRLNGRAANSVPPLPYNYTAQGEQAWKFLTDNNYAGIDMYVHNYVNNNAFFGYRDVQQDGTFQDVDLWKGSDEIGTALWGLTLNYEHFEIANYQSSHSTQHYNYLDMLVKQIKNSPANRGYFSADGNWIKSLDWTLPTWQPNVALWTKAGTPTFSTVQDDGNPVISFTGTGSNDNYIKSVQNFDNFVFEMKVKMTADAVNDCTPEVGFRVIDNNNRYLTMLNGEPQNQLLIGRYLGGVETSHVPYPAYNYNANQYYKYKIVANSTTIEQYLDDVLIRTWNDAGSAILNGGISLTNYGGTTTNPVYYDDVRIRNYAAMEPTSTYGDPESNPLPVELTSFTSKLLNDKILLNWSTKTEVNNYGFDVERKISDQWQKIGFVEGNGNSNSPKQYSFTDNKLVGGSSFQYRLKQIDNDGQYEYSKEVEVVKVPTEYALYQNYPNPFNPSTKIRYQLPNESKVVIKIYNILGSEVMELLNEQKEAGIYEVEFNAENLSSGTYIYKISADNFVQTKKMILLK